MLRRKSRDKVAFTLLKRSGWANFWPPASVRQTGDLNYTGCCNQSTGPGLLTVAIFTRDVMEFGFGVFKFGLPEPEFEAESEAVAEEIIVKGRLQT